MPSETHSDTPITLLFVYGTLKRGDVRDYLLADQWFVEEIRTAALYRMFNTGSYPALIEARPLGLEGRSIVGELWQIDRACLVRLDEEEGVGEGLYERRAIELLGEYDAVEAYFYVPTVDGMPDCGEYWPVVR